MVVQVRSRNNVLFMFVLTPWLLVSPHPKNSPVSLENVAHSLWTVNGPVVHRSVNPICLGGFLTLPRQAERHVS